jgi:regulatory protein
MMTRGKLSQIDNPSKRLRSRALYYLAKREYSAYELKEKLKTFTIELDLSQEDLRNLIAELQEQNLQSDDRFCESYINSKKSKFGALKLQHELTQKGVSEDIISNYISDLRDDEYNFALSVWKKKFDSPAKNQNEKAKQIRFMQSRGFGFEIIKKIIN